MIKKKMLLIFVSLVGIVILTSSTLGCMPEPLFGNESDREATKTFEELQEENPNSRFIMIESEDGPIIIDLSSSDDEDPEEELVDPEETPEDEEIIEEPEPPEDEPELPELEEDLNSEHLGRFTSYSEFISYIENHTILYKESWRYYLSDFVFGARIAPSFSGTTTNSVADGSGGTINQIVSSSTEKYHSTTNVQVYGVDEGDILKNDGDYAYIVSKDTSKVYVIDVYPAQHARIVSVIRTSGRIREIYLDGDTLVVLGIRTVYLLEPKSVSTGDDHSQHETVCYCPDRESLKLGIGNYYYFNYLSYNAAFIEIYDIKEREDPNIQNTHLWRGSIIQSRLIGDHLYVLTSQSINRDTKSWDLPVDASKIYYMKNSNNLESRYNYYYLTSILSIDISQPGKAPTTKSIVMDPSNQIFVSVGNIYMASSKSDKGGSRTIIHRISISQGKIMFNGTGSVPGYVQDRYFMDEHDGYFRIITGRHSQYGNSLYILDMDLKIVGSVRNIATGETLYSSRFMGNRAYLVTFKKVDPFFVIDLSNPKNPKILGELKIPGYSNYLHPYDENHVMGIGKDTYDMGSFAWYQGVKLSLFDVTDVKNPKEVAKYIIGDRGTESPALRESHAFLFSKRKSMLVIPIQLAEINRTKNPDPSPSTRGEYTWSGVYVFRISLDKGFELQGRISHEEGNGEGSGNYWNRYSDKMVKRSFYIDDTLYTLSNDYLKMNALSDLTEIKTLELASEDDGSDIPIICIGVESFSR